MANIIAVRAHGRKWTLATESGNRWLVERERGMAHGLTPQDAVAAAYMDGGRPSELYATKREALESIAA
jgi:hypothetical protein